MWRAALQLSSVCAALGLLRWAAALPTGACPTDSRGPGDIREIRCVGLRVPGAVDCTVEEESGAVHRSRLRLSGWGTAPLVTQLFNDRPRLVKQLEVTDSDLSSLSESAFRGLGSAQLLRLNGNRLSAVPEAALGRLPLLQTLVMNNNRIHRLLRHQLSAVPCLKYLSLAENGLRTIEPGALPAGLRHVGLKDNQLRTLNGTVRHLDDMKWLFVSNNELTSLGGQLPVDGALTSLMAYGNRLTSLDGVQDAAHLKLLNLNSNRLTQLDGRLQLPRLKKLHLSHNQIRQVSADQLSGFPALRELTLDDNELSELDPILSVLPNLTKLNISYNQLSSIAELAQTDRQGNVAAHPLQELFAVGNRITSVGQLNLPKLLKLNLSDNDLTEVSAANFAGMPSLEVLVLSGNRLQRIGQLLEALPALTRADFSDNSITSVTPLHPGEQVPHETKPRLLHLQTLLLNNNRLRLLDVSLYRLPALCVLDVRNNTISRLRWHQHKAWRCSLQHRKLRVNGNPVHCEDQEVRLSLRQAAQNFTLDVALCGGGGGPAAQVAPLSLGAR